MNMIRNIFSAMLLALVLLTACSSNPAFDEGMRLIAEGKPEEGVLRMEQGVNDRPDDIGARNQYFRQRETLTRSQLTAAERARTAGKLEAAEASYQEVLRFDRDNARAQQGLSEIAAIRRRQAQVQQAETLGKNGDAAAAENLLRTVLAEDPNQGDARRALKHLQEAEQSTRPSTLGIKGPFAKPITLEFRDTPLRAVFEVMSRTAGLNFVLDRDVKSDTKVTLFLRNTSIDEALRLILVTNQLDRKVLNENSVLIYPNTAAKNKDYQETVVRSFYLANTDAKQAQALIKTVVKSKDIFIDEKLNLVVIKDTPDAVRLAERLIESLDLALPEVMLEVEVLEVSRNRLLNLGIEYPDHVGYGRLTPDTSSITTSAGSVVSTATAFGGALTPGNVSLRALSSLTSYVANPGVVLNLKKQDGDSKLLANPRIRVINREKAKIHIGDKLPVFTTTSTANVGVAASVSYLDVGLKLEVEPTVHLDENVEMKVSLEVSSIVKEVTGPSSSLAYQIGTRSATTALRLRDGETQILAGLINDEERTNASRIPGLGDLPVLGRLFSSQSDSKNKTEIVLLITPHVIRNVTPPILVTPTSSAGTESAIGAAPLTIKSGALRGISGATGPGRPTPVEGVAPEGVPAQDPPPAEQSVVTPVPPPAGGGQ